MAASAKDLVAAAECLRGTRVLILGDMVADIYLDGRISRISREAPVLVLEEMGERVVAGGAANVAHNAATLGGAVCAFGILGEDAGGAGISSVLSHAGVDTAGLLTTSERPTISKTRVIAGGRATVSQQIVRIDKESREPLSSALAEELEERLLQALAHVDAVVLSDYGSGTITQGIRERLLVACRGRGVPTIVDSRYSVRSFSGVDDVKQNDAELAAA
ncbi:MAG: bifunctional heptose 7-phosphate kinase/heptose 1-phosphate adenyltransferase, partial [Selenomonas sp.]